MLTIKYTLDDLLNILFSAQFIINYVTGYCLYIAINYYN